jgi:hypothetical protein
MVICKIANDYKNDLEDEMKRYLTLAMIGLMLLLGSATTSRAEVKRVEMHIAGYLCGN